MSIRCSNRKSEASKTKTYASQYWVLLLAFLSFCNVALAADGQTGTGEKIRIAYSSLSGNTAPLWVTYEQGFFGKHGIEPELVLIEGGSTTVRALAAAEVSFAQMAGSAAIQSSLWGSEVILIGGLVNTLTFQLITDPKINQPELLKGTSVGVTRWGSSTDFAVRYALDRWGLIPQKDINIVELASMPNIFAALKSRKIQSAILSAPFTFQAKKVGFVALADLQMLGLEYQHTGIVTRKSLIRSRPDLVRKFMKAYVEGIHYYKTHREESLAIMAKYLKTNDIEALAETYQTIGVTLVPEKPYPTLNGIQVILQELSSREPKAKSARPEQFIDSSFVRELDASGFIDGLYRKTKAIAVHSDKSSPAPPAQPINFSSNVNTTGLNRPTPQETKSKQALSPVLAGQSSSTENGSSKETGSGEEYIINAGDTLSKLAERFYGTQSQWGRIYEANRTSVKNPNFIYIGQRIIIPPI
jgi:NitT/TauT family transport system substrate-binding protein